jgi:hypothetical protein
MPMSWLKALNLIAVLDYYLVITFVVSTVMRYRQYRVMAGLVISASARWPKLLQVLTSHRRMFFTWPTLLPSALTFLLMFMHLLAYNLVWPTARLSPIDLWEHWLVLAALLVLGIAMLVLDYDACFNIWEIERQQIEPYLDQAEYWLSSWASPAVRILTLGYVNPKQRVHDEVFKALTSASVDVNKMMWRWALQIGVRLAFGLTLWFTWYLAVHGRT